MSVLSGCRQYAWNQRSTLSHPACGIATMPAFQKTRAAPGVVHGPFDVGFTTWNGTPAGLSGWRWTSGCAGEEIDNVLLTMNGAPLASVPATSLDAHSRLPSDGRRIWLPPSPPCLAAGDAG